MLWYEFIDFGRFLSFVGFGRFWRPDPRPDLGVPEWPIPRGVPNGLFIKVSGGGSPGGGPGGSSRPASRPGGRG